MPMTISDAEEAVRRAEQQLEDVLAEERGYCAHEHLYQTDRASGGYMWMCAKCRAEVHGWTNSSTVFRYGWIKKVSHDEYMSHRPHGAKLHRLENWSS